MRTISMLAAVIVAAFVIAFGQSAVSAATAKPSSPQQAQCDAQRKACYAAKTQVGTYGERYVPPDAVKECESGYRMCMGRN
jgi:hypothetical protein